MNAFVNFLGTDAGWTLLAVVAVVAMVAGIKLARWAAAPVVRAERLPSFAKDYAKGLKATSTQLVHDDDAEWAAYADRK